MCGKDKKVENVWMHDKVAEGRRLQELSCIAVTVNSSSKRIGYHCMSKYQIHTLVTATKLLL